MTNTDECLTNDAVHCVYIALPNNLHCDYTIRAARAGVHVLCEKPMAIDEDECQRMIDATRRHRIKLMIAYRLHFDEANLRAVELVRSGKLGEPRLFNSVFTMQIKPGDIRVQAELGGGTLYGGLYRSGASGKPTQLRTPATKRTRPRIKQAHRRPAIHKPQLVNARPPSRD